MDLYLPFCSEYLFCRRMTQLQDSTSLVQCAVDLSTTPLIYFKKSPGRDTGLSIWTCMDNWTPAVQYSPGLSKHHTMQFSSWNVTQKKDAREVFEFWRRKYHPETHDEQTRWSSRHHNTPVSPTALCSQKVTSPEPNFWLLLCADLGLLCFPQREVACLIWPSRASSSDIWLVPQTGLQWDTCPEIGMLMTKHSPPSRLHQVGHLHHEWYFFFPTHFVPAC